MIPLTPGCEPIPKHHLVRRLGEGSFGEVWLADGPGGVPVALKFIRLQGATGAKELASLMAIRHIRNPYLLPITGLWFLDRDGQVTGDAASSGSSSSHQMTLTPQNVPTEPPEMLVVSMLLGDKSLGDVLGDHRAQGRVGVPIDELLRYMEDAAKGLDYLNSPIHTLGESTNVAIHHRDVKPDNILLVGGTAVICDFGVARVLRNNSNTMTEMAGSPYYIAPESIEDRQTTRTTDQYSLAVSYYQLRTGKVPFPENSNRVSVMNSHIQGTLLMDGVADAELKVLERATSLDPADRFETCRDMVEALRAATSLGETVKSELKETIKWPSAARSAGTSSRRFLVPVFMGVLVLALGALGGMAWYWNSNPHLTNVNDSASDGESLQVAVNGTNHRVDVPVDDGADGQRVTADENTTSDELEQPDEVVNSIQLTLRLIPAGEFLMGTEGSDVSADNENRHRVVIRKPFYISTTEVTQQQWVWVMQSRPWEGKTNVDSRADEAAIPASYLSWEDATTFCQRLSQLEPGRNYRLPTEAEWEYAARANSTSDYYFGPSSEALGDHAWFRGNALRVGEKFPHPVALKQPNAWGLFDTYGNVFEWCGDWYDPTYGGEGPMTDPRGPSTGTHRVLRGGGWGEPATNCRSAYRTGRGPTVRFDDQGIRIVLETETSP